MIPAITEVNFPSYATLHQAAVSLQEMGERNITTQVRIDGSVVPSFSGWELLFKGERFILDTRDPQASKDNTTRDALVDLTFTSWVINELKRYYFFEPTSVEAGVVVADKYKASIGLNIEDFVVMFNKVLDYYFGGKVVMSLYLSGTPGLYSQDRVYQDINYTYIWDLLTKFYDTFGVRWLIEYDSTTEVYTIKAGYPAAAITDHDFEYGYKGGLLRFERQVQDVDIRNILLGRGGEKNLPYRYFKIADPQNPEWAADPDAIPELANITFDRLRDAVFRWYVRGWMHNPNRDTIGDEAWDPGHVFPTYSIDSSSPYYWAYQKGLTDETFNPVEYVKDGNSITAYGEKWGAVEDNDEVFPTIQAVSRGTIGRIDETVAVSEIETDDIDAMSKAASIEKSINPLVISTGVGGSDSTQYTLMSETFAIPEGSTGRIDEAAVVNRETAAAGGLNYVDTTQTTMVVVNQNTGVESPIAGIAAGTYRLKINLVLHIGAPSGKATGTFGYENIKLVTSEQDADAWKPTFDIWVKNIWNTTKDEGESEEQYAARVWESILGDRAGNEAKVVFSTGFMSVSEDYEFVIASYPVHDTSKSILVDGQAVPSEWRITLRKSDAEYDTTGLYIPNASTGGKPAAGDKFFFVGIDMPQAYVELAEESLNTSKGAELDNTKDTNPTWVIALDKVRCNTLEDGEYGQTLADRLAAGAKVWIKDQRFTPGEKLQLFVQSINYTWNEPSDGSPYLVPDIEVVLSDKVIAREGTVSQMQGAIAQIKEAYARISDVEAVVRKVAEPLFLKKTGESDTSDSPTQFASKVTSKGFRQGGIGGTGWGFYTDNTSEFAVEEQQPEQTRSRARTLEAEEPKGETVLEADRIVARKALEVNSLVINQIEAIGGKEILSAAKIEVTKVIESSSSYVCYFNQRQNSVANLFAVNDIAMGQVFNAENAELRYYKMLVTAVDLDSITLAKANKVGDGEPKVGDVIVQFGNTSVASRQYVILRDVIGGGYERMLSGLSSLSATGDEYYFAGRQSGDTSPRWFVGAAAGEYAKWQNGQLEIKGTILVKNGNTYTDPSYLAQALPADSTLIQGGLVLSKTIALTDGNNNIMAGINGVPTLSNIAAWYGGPMADKEASPTPQSYAKSLFRFDGSGYLANGGIHWDANGYGGIPGINWSQASGGGVDVTIGANVKLAQTGGDGSTVTDLVSVAQQITRWFEEVTINGVKYLRLKIQNNGVQGLVTDGIVSSGGLSEDADPGGSLDADLMFRYLANDPTLEDTSHNDDQIAVAHLTTALSNYVPATRKVNNKALSTDITLTLDDVADGTTRKLSDINALADAIGNLATGFSGIEDDIDQLREMTATKAWVDNVLADSFVTIGSTKVNIGATALTLAGLSSVESQRFYLDQNTYFGIDSDGYVHLYHPQGKGLVVDGVLSSGGLSEGTDPGGGLDADLMFDYLANNVSGDSSHDRDQIHPLHLETALTGYVNDLTISGSGNYVASISKAGKVLTATMGTLGDAAFRGIATAIGSSVTGLVDGALLYGILGDSFDASNTVKGFVNSSIATATATYRGSYNLVSDLSLSVSTATHSTIATALGTAVSTADNNDYCYVEIPTSDSTPTQIARVDRYKHNGTGWGFEYTLNNSGYTAAQWAAINSGITSTKVSTYDTVAGYFENGKIKSVTLPAMYLGYSQVAFSQAKTTLLGVNGFTNATSDSADNDTSKVVWEPNGGGAGIGVWHFYGNVVIDGFASSGGLSSGTGGGGDLDADLMFKYLANDQSLSDHQYDNAQIDAAHLVTALSDYLNVKTARSANTVYAGPTSGNAAAPTFRALVAADIPAISYSKISDWSTATANFLTAANTDPMADAIGNLATGLSGMAADIESLNEIAATKSWVSNLVASIDSELPHFGASLSAATNALSLVSKDGTALSTLTAENMVTILGTAAVGRATGDADGNAIKTTYLKLAGGTMTGELQTSSAISLVGYSNNKFQIHFTEWPSGTTNANVDLGWNWGDRAGSGAAFRGVVAGQADSGACIFFARNATSTSQFRILPDGSIQFQPTESSQWGDILHAGNYSSYALPLSGGTMTGALTLKANQYSGLSGYGMNANNSDIVGVNSIYTEDLADDMGEGIHFFRSSGYWDSLTSSNGVLYYYPNRPTATTAFANAYTIYHSGNANKSDVSWACNNLSVNGNAGFGVSSPVCKVDTSDMIHVGGTRLSTTSGNPSEFGSTIRGTFIYSNGIGFMDNYLGTSGNDSSWIRQVETTSNDGYLEIATGDDGTESIYFRSYNTSNVVAKEFLKMDGSNGCIGINNTSPSYRLHVGGDIVATGAITAGSASDARLKTNVANISNEQARAIVMALRPVNFTWNEKATSLFDQYKGDDTGFIAQEVEPLLPMAIGTIFDEYKRLDATKMIPAIVKVEQDHETRIVQLEARVKELEAEIARLRS